MFCCPCLKRTEDADGYIQFTTESGFLLRRNTTSDIENSSEDKETGDDSNTRVKEDTSNVKHLLEAQGEQTVTFVKHLADKHFYAGESVVLVCQLNKDECQVIWSKDEEIVTNTETVKIISYKDSHFLIIPEAVTENSGKYTCTYKDLSTSASVIVSRQEVLIRKQLHVDNEGDIREYMKISVSCDINIPGKTPRWFHNSKEIEKNNERVTFDSSDCKHKLIINNVELDDKGEYMVVFDRVISKTSITVTEQEVLIHKQLHVDNEGDIREYMKVSLSCDINIPGITPRWFHNREEIEGNNERVTFDSSDCKHKLIIHNVELEDKGEYMVMFDRVTSQTSITVTGHTDITIKQQIKQANFQHWVKGVLALKYLKLGLELPVEIAVKKHHEQILKALPKTVSNECLECNSKNLLPSHEKRQCPRTTLNKCLCSRNARNRRLCPNNELCSEIYDKIVNDHRYQDPALNNTSMGKWSTDPWSIAACYISHTSGPEHKKSSKDMECAELLCLFVNNTKYLKNTRCNVFDTARMHRNELMHNKKYEISHEKLSEYLKDFKDVLEVKDNSNETVFTHDEARQALKAISDLQNYQIDINTREEIENMKKDSRAKAMVEFTEKLEHACSQNRVLRERLNEETNKTMDIMCEKHDGTLSTWLCIDHAISFCKSCMEKEHRKCSGLRKLTERHTYDKPVSIVVKESLKQENSIVAICALPNGEYLAQFEKFSRFEVCKLNETFDTIARCDLLQNLPASMCYVGNNKVAFNFRDYQLLFIDVKNLQFLEQKVTLIENVQEVQHLACHGDKIYAFNGSTVFSYTIDETQVRPLCELSKSTIVYKNMGTSMTVSDNGDFIYCTNQSGHVYQVDSSDGNVLLELNLHGLQLSKKTIVPNNSFLALSGKADLRGVDELNLCSVVDVCYIGNGTVIVFDSEGHIIQIESHGDYSIQTIDEMKRNSIITYISTIYDRSTSSLIAIDGGTIKIFRVT